MIGTLVFLSVWLQLSITEIPLDFDPRKFNYCKKKCTNTTGVYEHVACHCNKIEGKREEIMEDFLNFRTKMVDLHNRYRNRLARGEDNVEFGFPNASNMHVLNYDLELEYIARCYGKTFYEGRDRCRWKHDMDWVHGQSIYGNPEKKKQDDAYYEDILAKWYSEIANVGNKSVIDTFEKGPAVKIRPDAKITRFTQLIWATATHLGCSRVYIEHNPKSTLYHSTVICNYAGLQEGSGGCEKGSPIYKRGEPCTQCPNGEKCNKDYGGQWDALCGKSNEIPMHEPYDYEERKNKNEASCLGLTLQVFLLFFCLITFL